MPEWSEYNDYVDGPPKSQAATGQYGTKTVQTPPTIKEIDGQWFIAIHDGGATIQAPVGEWFAAQFITRVVLPKLVLDAMK